MSPRSPHLLDPECAVLRVLSAAAGIAIELLAVLHPSDHDDYCDLDRLDLNHRRAHAIIHAAHALRLAISRYRFELHYADIVDSSTPLPF